MQFYLCINVQLHLQVKAETLFTEICVPIDRHPEITLKQLSSSLIVPVKINTKWVEPRHFEEP